MSTLLRRNSPRGIASLASIYFVIATAVAIVSGPGSVCAADTLAYSFEPDLQGFGPNGGGTTVTQDTIGATEGTHSMKVSVVSGATFVGALTGNLDANVFGDPPGLDHVTFDMTLTAPFGPPEPPTGFAVVGVIIFGVSQPDFPGGQLNVQTQIDLANEQHIDGKAAGTHEVTIDLSHFMNHPLTFEADKSFNDIFGTVGSGPNDIIPTGFELYFNKTGSGGLTGPHELNVYIDNIRFGTTPAAVPGDYNGNGTVDAADYVTWRNGGPLLNEVADPGSVTANDYTEWRARFGNTSGSGNGLTLGAVPEPVSIFLALVVGACCCGGRLWRRAQWKIIVL